MSIIIRLQNLPLSAKSADIRRFFGGLRIPNGGVHIVGGDEGDAFIAFTTDEDARLAMRKDGGKILDNRVKLYLSSRVEMQQEIGRFAKDDSRQRSPERISERDDRNYHSKSPPRGRRFRSKSPDRRSRSPRRRSRSPRRRSRSPDQRTLAHHRPISPLMKVEVSSSHGHSKTTSSENMVDIEKLFGLSKGSTSWKGQDFGRSEEHSLLEQKFAEALSASLSSIGKTTGMYNNSGRAVNEPPMHQLERIREPGVNMQAGRVIDSVMNMQRGQMGQPMNMQRGPMGETEMNMQRSRMGEPVMNMQGGRMGDPVMNMQAGRMGEPMVNMHAGRVSEGVINMQRGPMGEPLMNMQRGPMGEPVMNMQRGPMGEPVMNMQRGPMCEPVMNMQRGPMGEPIMNMQRGPMGEPMVNMQAGRVSEPVLNMQRGINPPMHIQGGNINNLRMNLSAGRGEQFSNLNPNMMPFRPEFNRSGPHEASVQVNNNLVMPNMPPPANMSMPTNIPPGLRPLQYPPPMNAPPMVNLPPPVPVPSSMPPATMPPPMQQPPMQNAPMGPPNITPNMPLEGFFVTLVGLDPLWNFSDLQAMLKGVFLPTKNIKWELDSKWSKTGTAYVKLYNRHDFMQLVSHKSYFYENRTITVGESPDFVINKYFTPEAPTEGSLNSPKGEFYHKIAGLPYEANYDNVLNFFNGLEVIDLYILYSKDNVGFRIQGKATGIAFIGFGNAGDASKALQMDGQRFASTKRIIHVTPSTKQVIFEARQKNNDLLSQSIAFIPAPAAVNNNNPMCVLLTGLPQNVTKQKIINFFRKCSANLGLIHITLNDQQKPNGRAYVTFHSSKDLEAALQCHYKKMGDNVICVKQVLFEEMKKGLESSQPLENSLQNSNSRYSPSTERSRIQHDSVRIITSGRNNIQVFEYGNQSKPPVSVSNTTSNQSFDEKKPLKPCLKSSNRSYENNKTPEKTSTTNVSKSIPTLLTGESKKPESSIVNLVQNSISNKCERGNAFIKAEPMSAKKEYKHIPSTSIEIQAENEALNENMDTEEASRNPVKFEVKIKPAISKSTKVEDAFDNADPKKKLSKLSPDRSLATSSTVAQMDKAAKSLDNNKDIEIKSNDKKAEDDKLPKTKSTDDVNKNIKTKIMETAADNKNIKTTGTADDNKNVKTKKAEPVKNTTSKSTNEDKSSKGCKTASKRRSKSPVRNAKTDKLKPSDTHSSSSRDSRTQLSRNSSRDRGSKRYDDKRHRSPDRQRSPNRHQSPDRHRSPGRQRSPEYRHRSPTRFVYRKRPHSRSLSPLRRPNYPSLDPYPYHRKSEDEAAVVQLSNVHQLIGSAELLLFFYGFEIDPEKIIRRIDDQGEPTGDVRVTFRNRRMSELAIRKLNGKYLNGLPVTMFHVD